MCGICGLTYLDNRIPERNILEKMNAAISHRGPDSDGFYANAGVGLAMRRLAIIDVAGGDQPMFNEDQSCALVFNGQIYNYLDLRAELFRRGHKFSTKTDTECILHLYEDEGDDVVNWLRGMFAFALWDQKKRRLFIARDRMGQKPLYYTLQNGVFYFASELNSLLSALPRHPAIDLESIDLYLSLQYIPEPRTAYRGIYKLPPAHTLIWENGKVSLNRYWDYAYGPKHTVSEDELAEELRVRLTDAVRMRLMSEVPLGAHLSGGIDSSVIVALMAEINETPVKTFSVGFEEESFSELEYARAVAQRYATDHHEFILTYGDIPATSEKLIRHFGEPFADPSAIPLYLLSKMTRKYVTVALNGDGGDESFAGYQRYWLDPLANAYLRGPRFLTHGLFPNFARFLPDRTGRPVGQSLISGLKRLEQLAHIDKRASILRWGSYFSPWQRQALWKQEYWQNFYAANAENLLSDYFDKTDGSFLDCTLYTDLHSYLPGDLLVKADRMTMAASLEGRSPFLDHELVAWSACLPDHLKVRGRSGKYLLRKAFANYLPERIQGRGKQGFGIPVSAWFRGSLANWSREELLGVDTPLRAWFNIPALESILAEHQNGRVDHGKRIWALMMLVEWLKNVKGH